MRFSSEILDQINVILSNAHQHNRDMLYEYEVYGILKAIGLDVPGYVLIDNPSRLEETDLRPFHQALVLKVVSPQIAHKQKVGGVQIIQQPELQKVRQAMTDMEAEIRSHYPETEMPRIEGFLLVEFVPFTQALGYESLLGFKEDPAFGPILTLSKGGDDAEFFAKYYDPANLILPPFEMEQALQLVNTLNIRHKFEAMGHGEYMTHMAKAASLLSELAYSYSGIAERKPEYVIREMDINPFVITKDHRYVAVDGFAKFAPFTEKEIVVPKLHTNNLELFFRPQGVAVVGVSADMAKNSMAREIAHMLHDQGRDDLYFINARGGSITFDGMEYPLYKSVSEIQIPVELVVYAAPAQHTVNFLSELKDKPPGAVVLISGIPSDTPYQEFKARLDAATPPETRILGPNCIGVYHAEDERSKAINTFFLDEKRLEVKSSPSSNTVLLTQSGALAITLIDRFKSNRVFKSVVSFGNKYDVKVTDLAAYFEQQAGIDLIAMYMEGQDAGEGRSFYELARKLTKPVIVYKSGKTEAGARAAASHTASMSGSYDVFKAACMQAGIILAEKIEDYEDYIRAFSLLSRRIPAGNRVAAVLNAGFESTVGADELNHLKQAVLSPDTVEKLKKIDKYGLVDISSSFLDLTPSADDSVYAGFIEAVLQDENVDCLFVSVVPHCHSLKSDPDTCHDPDSLASRLAEMMKLYKKPVVVSVNAGSYYQEFVSIMEEGGLPVYGNVRSAVKSLDRFVSYHLEK